MKNRLIEANPEAPNDGIALTKIEIYRLPLFS